MDAHEVQVLLQRLAFAEAKRDALERQLQESYDLSDRHKVDYDRAIARLQQNENELARMRKALDDLNKTTRRDYEGEVASIREEFQRQRLTMVDDNTKLEYGLEQTELRLGDVLAQRDRQREQCDRLSEEVRDLSNSYAVALDETKQLKAELKAADAELGQLQEEFGRAEAHIEQIEGELERSNKDVDRAQKANKQLTQANGALQQELAGVQEEHNETKQTVVAVEQERDHLRRRVDEQQSQLEYYEQAAQKLHLQISQERATFTTAAQTSNAAHQKQLVETQQALANATRELDQLKASVHRRETTLIDQNQSALQRFQSAAAEEYSQLMERLRELEQSRSEIRAELEDTRRHAFAMQTDLDHANQETQRIREQLATVQEDRDKLAEQATAQRDHYVKQNRALKADLSHLRSALDECESENETLLAQQMDIEEALRVERERNIVHLKYMQQMLHKEEEILNKNRELEMDREHLRLQLRELGLVDLNGQESGNELDDRDGAELIGINGAKSPLLLDQAGLPVV